MRSENKSVLAAVVALLLVVLMSTSCGDFFPSSHAIVAITISPTNVGVSQSTATEQFTAQGTYGNGNTGDVTGLVNWSSSSAAVATINQAGLATLVGQGTTTITAKSSDTSASTTLAVLNISSLSISITSGSTTLTAGGTAQLKAVDQNGNDVTNFVTWASSDTSIVSVTDGTVTASSLTVGGTSNITATFPSSTGSTTITSNAITFTVTAG
jgi:hypothetical protein